MQLALQRLCNTRVFRQRWLVSRTVEQRHPQRVHIGYSDFIFERFLAIFHNFKNCQNFAQKYHFCQFKNKQKLNFKLESAKRRNKIGLCSLNKTVKHNLPSTNKIAMELISI